MSLNARESLSALMDNEGDELELRRVLKSLESDSDAAQRWRRYHLMRSALRRETEGHPGIDISAGVMARLEQEPAPIDEAGLAGDQLHAAARARGGMSFARGAGIAAAVSLMVISGVQFYNGSLNDPGAGVEGIASSGTSGSDGLDMASTSAANDAATPVAASNGSTAMPSLAELPLFNNGTAGQASSGLMTVGASPMFLAPSAQQSMRGEQAQAQLLQSYLERHAQGAAFSGADNWMPMLREVHEVR